MSGTPGHVSLRSVCDRLFHRPMRATRHWKGTKSSRNRCPALGFSKVPTNDETAASYSVFRLIQLVFCFASRIAFSTQFSIRSQKIFQSPVSFRGSDGQAPTNV